MGRGKKLFGLIMVMVMLCTSVFAATYNISYEIYTGVLPDGATLSTSYDDSQTMIEFANAQPQPALEGYGFMGWYYESDYTNGYVKISDGTYIYADKQFVAGYAPAATFYASGTGSNGESVVNTFDGGEEYKAEVALGDPNNGFDATVQFTQQPKAIENYEFLYYYETVADTDASDGSSNYAVSAITAIDDAPGGTSWYRPTNTDTTKIYHARYKTLYSFDANGGEWAGSVNAICKAAPADVQANEPTNGTKTFLGWYESDLETAVSYAEMSAKPAGYTFYAKWGKLTPSYTLPTGLTAIYKDTLSDIDLSAFATTDGSFSWTDGTTEVGEVGDRTHSIKYTPADAANYETVTDSVTITVGKANPVIEINPAASAVAINSTLSASVLTGGVVRGVNNEVLTGSFAWADPTAVLATAGNISGNAVVFTPDNQNYNSANCNVTVRVNAASPAPTPGGGTFIPNTIKVHKADNEPKDDTVTENEDSNNQGGSGLATDPHIAYLEGYEDGRFMPEAKLTRAEAAAIISRVAKEPIDMEKDYPVSFTDVAADAWYAKYIGFVETLGVVNGYSDGTFRPDENITRAELVAILARIAGGELTYTDKFTDVTEEHWAAKYISYAYTNGWINGYPDGTFRPDDSITRAEAAKIINMSLERKSTNTDFGDYEVSVFTDLDASHWSYKYIIEAATSHRYMNKQDGTEIWTGLVE